MLSELDARALDALVDHGFEDGKAAMAGGVDAARVAKAAGLLALLEIEPALHSQSHDALTDVTLARLERATGVRGEAPAEGMYGGDFELCDDDADALDALVTSDYDLSRVPGVLRARAARIDGLLALSGVGVSGEARLGGGDGEDLVARTMANVPLRVRPRERMGWSAGGIRMADLVSIAAVLLIAASIVWPLLSTIRNQQRQAACGSNFASVAGAMGAYAGDYRDHFPVASASLGGPTWWDVGAGAGKSNSANLYQLPKLQYASLATLACPSNPSAPRGSCSPVTDDWSCIKDVSYSYQVMFGADRPVWKQQTPVVMLADASPVTRRASAGETIFPEANSQNHDGRGQWALLSDGSGRWLSRPVMGSDNIWLPATMELMLRKAAERIGAGETGGMIEIHGNELPESANDSFLGP